MFQEENIQIHQFNACPLLTAVGEGKGQRAIFFQYRNVDMVAVMRRNKHLLNQFYSHHRQHSNFPAVRSSALYPTVQYKNKRNVLRDSVGCQAVKLKWQKESIIYLKQIKNWEGQEHSPLLILVKTVVLGWVCCFQVTSCLFVYVQTVMEI